MTPSLYTAKGIAMDGLDRSFVERGVRFGITLDDISAVPHDWTRIQVYVKNRGRCIADAAFRCSDGRVCLRGMRAVDHIVFLLCIQRAHSGAVANVEAEVDCEVIERTRRPASAGDRDWRALLVDRDDDGRLSHCLQDDVQRSTSCRRGTTHKKAPTASRAGRRL